MDELILLPGTPQFLIGLVNNARNQCQKLCKIFWLLNFLQRRCVVLLIHVTYFELTLSISTIFRTVCLFFTYSPLLDIFVNACLADAPLESSLSIWNESGSMYSDDRVITTCIIFLTPSPSQPRTQKCHFPLVSRMLTLC